MTKHTKPAKVQPQVPERQSAADDALDEALDETFPASDPISVHADPDFVPDRRGKPSRG
jgi:hypothetical protein